MTSTVTYDSIVLRPANADDGAALDRLAALDESPVPEGELLLAEADGSLRAALAISDGAYVADPFSPTGELVALLDARATRLRAELPLRDRIRARLAVWERLWMRATELRPTQ
jgi:hypothetical protein